MVYCMVCFLSDFNPHSPCGERPGIAGNHLRPEDISIHTPHAGSDNFNIACFMQLADFNPHSPCGERHVLPSVNARRTYFNPHSPCGERQSLHPRAPHCIAISIHTPHAGSDICISVAAAKQIYFNPHSPCGERHQHRPHPAREKGFQSTLPMRGATLYRRFSGRGLANFNPHSPCGERQQICTKITGKYVHTYKIEQNKERNNNKIAVLFECATLKMP